MKEELYIIEDGRRYEVDLPEKNSITLRFLSNMFSDLSKFCASYSYTFKLPKTVRNQRTFDMLDDFRHESTSYGKKMECEYWRDGILLVHDSYLYIQEVTDSYSAVMTWNVLKWLSKVNEDGLSLRDLDVSDDDPTVIGWGTGLKTASSFESNMDDRKASVYYRCGRLYQPVQYNPPLVPVRYLLNIIARHYDMSGCTALFDFMREEALDGEDFDKANGEQFSIFEDGVLPLVSGEWSERLYKRNTRCFNMISTVRYETDRTVPMCSYVRANSVIYLPNFTFLMVEGGEGLTSFYDLYEHSGFAQFTGVDVSTDNSWEAHSQSTGKYIAFRPKTPYKGCLRGKLSFYCTTVVGSGKLYLMKMHYSPGQGSGGMMDRYVPYTDDDGGIKDLIEIGYSRSENNVYDFVFDPEEGGSEVELTVESDYLGYSFWVLVTDMKGYVTEGTLKLVPMHENSQIMDEVSLGSIPGAKDYNEVDLFANLPQISTMDFLKSLFYIENAYPVVRRDGRIGKMHYRDLYTNIRNGNVYDWSNAVIKRSGSTDITRRFTNGELGRKNVFSMSNANNTGKGLEEYAPATSSFETRNETLVQKKILYSFPYSSASIRSESGIMTGNTFAYWVRKDKSFEYEVASVNPIIGRVMKHAWLTLYQNPGYQRAYIDKNLLFRIWQVSDVDYSNTVLAKIMHEPKVMELPLSLDAYTLSMLDFTKPVYIEQENAYFGIISLQLDSKDITKAELIKLPVLTESELKEEGEKSPLINVSGPLVLYKAQEGNVSTRFEFDAFVNRSHITFMRLSLDGEVVGEAENIGHISYYYLGTNGDHVLSCTARAANGTETTLDHRFRVSFIGEQGVIPHIGIDTDMEFMAQVSYSSAKRNIKTFRINIYNTADYQDAELSVDDKMVKRVTSGDSFSYDYDYNYLVEKIYEGLKSVNVEAVMRTSDGYIYNEVKTLKLSLELPSWYRPLSSITNDLFIEVDADDIYQEEIGEDESRSISGVFSNTSNYVVTAICYFKEQQERLYPLYARWQADCYDENGNKTVVILSDDVTRISSGFTFSFSSGEYGRYERIELYCYAMTGSVFGTAKETSGRLIMIN